MTITYSILVLHQFVQQAHPYMVSSQPKTSTKSTTVHKTPTILLIILCYMSLITHSITLGVFHNRNPLNLDSDLDSLD